MNDLIKHRWVKIMCEFQAEPVWSKGGGSSTLDDLPVSSDLRSRLRAWQARYDADADEFDHLPQDFTDQGLALAKEVKRELPGWTVIYFDEAKYDAGRPVSEFEYEVRL